jgi:hypothetical protein
MAKTCGKLMHEMKMKKAAIHPSALNQVLKK